MTKTDLAKSQNCRAFQKTFGYFLLFVLHSQKMATQRDEKRKGEKREQENYIMIQERGDVLPPITVKQFPT